MDSRLAGYLEDASAAVLVTQSSYEARAHSLGGEGATWKVSGAGGEEGRPSAGLTRRG